MHEDRDDNGISWDNVHQLLDASCENNIEKVKHYYDLAVNNSNGGIKPSEPPPEELNYQQLKEKVEQNLVLATKTQAETHQKLKEIEELQQPFSNALTNYNQEIELIEAQIQKIEECLSQQPADGDNEDIRQLQAQTQELTTLLGEFKKQRDILEEQLKKIETFPSTLFENSPKPNPPGDETSDPRLLMKEAFKISEVLFHSLDAIKSTCYQFFSACHSILQKANNFFTSNTSKVYNIIESSNKLITNLTLPLTQTPGNTM